jgi:hypothetical protein
MKTGTETKKAATKKTNKVWRFHNRLKDNPSGLSGDRKAGNPRTEDRLESKI